MSCIWLTGSGHGLPTVPKPTEEHGGSVDSTNGVLVQQHSGQDSQRPVWPLGLFPLPLPLVCKCHHRLYGLARGWQKSLIVTWQRRCPGDFGYWDHRHNIEGSGPEWYIPSMLYSRNMPFWSGTIDIICEFDTFPLFYLVVIVVPVLGRFLEIRTLCNRSVEAVRNVTVSGHVFRCL